MGLHRYAISSVICKEFSIDKIIDRGPSSPLLLAAGSWILTCFGRLVKTFVSFQYSKFANGLRRNNQNHQILACGLLFSRFVLCSKASESHYFLGKGAHNGIRDSSAVFCYIIALIAFLSYSATFIHSLENYGNEKKVTVTLYRPNMRKVQDYRFWTDQHSPHILG